MNGWELAIFISTLLSNLYFPWRQNKIFERQNQIFATQAGQVVDSKKAPFSRRGPLFGMMACALLLFGAIAFDYYDRRHAVGGPTDIFVLASALLGCAASVFITERRNRVDQETVTKMLSASVNPTSRLRLHSVKWGTSFHQKLVTPAVDSLPKDALAFIASNDTFKCDPVPTDTEKFVEIEYSYGDGPTLKCIRPQGVVVVLPEDQWLAAAFRESVTQFECANGIISKLTSQAHQETWGKIGIATHLSVEAGLLLEDLKRLAYEWDMAGTKLLYPLSVSIIPDLDKPLSWNVRELLVFRSKYRNHLRMVGLSLPGFVSPLTQAGFPCDSIDTYYVERMIEMHADRFATFIKETLSKDLIVP